MTNIDQPNPDTWVLLFEAQLKIQTMAYGRDPRDITDPKERIQFFRDMREALEAELQEATDEIGWKPWATSKHFNEEAVQGELSDVLLFFINLCLVANASPEVIATKTFEKMQRNLDRQLAGYDGVTGKCQQCGRALDDTAVTCFTDDTGAWCGELVDVRGFYGPHGYFSKGSNV